MLALPVEAPLRVGNVQVEPLSTSDHDVDAITRTSNCVSKCADGVFGTHRHEGRGGTLDGS
jgi:hypothetical protein